MNRKSLPFKQWLNSTPFLLMHLAALAAFLVPFSGTCLWICAAGYVIRMFAITAGYHRYFAHRAYKTSRIFQFALAWIGSAALQKGVLWWAGHHRHHHVYSDQPQDLHSPIQDSFWWSHVGWILSDQYNETRWDLIPDLAKYPELRWLNRYHLVPGIFYAVALYFFGGWSVFVWGFLVSTVILWHGTFTINSLAHVFGNTRYLTNDKSKNNFLLALLTLGEGWHNNHHCYMKSANQGFYWWEIDISYYCLKVLSWFGIVHKLNKPPLKLLMNRLKTFESDTESVHPTFKQSRAI
jgi:stearoyl-CoA desaturase (Delta-9 desaturase)